MSLDRGRTVQRRCARDPEPAQKQKDRKRPCVRRRSAPGDGNWRPHPDGFHYAIELVREAAALGCFSIGVAGFPEIHPRAVDRMSDLKFLKGKVDAGATTVITQLFFDNDDYYRFAEDLRKLGLRVPIVPGVLPILSASQVRRFTALCCAKIPPKLESNWPRSKPTTKRRSRSGSNMPPASARN